VPSYIVAPCPPEAKAKTLNGSPARPILHGPSGVVAPAVGDNVSVLICSFGVGKDRTRQLISQRNYRGLPDDDSRAKSSAVSQLLSFG